MQIPRQNQPVSMYNRVEKSDEKIKDIHLFRRYDSIVGMDDTLRRGKLGNLGTVALEVPLLKLVVRVDD